MQNGVKDTMHKIPTPFFTLNTNDHCHLEKNSQNDPYIFVQIKLNCLSKIFSYNWNTITRRYFKGIQPKWCLIVIFLQMVYFLTLFWKKCDWKNSIFLLSVTNNNLFIAGLPCNVSDFTFLMTLKKNNGINKNLISS